MGRKSLIFISIIFALAMTIGFIFIVYADYGINNFTQCRNDTGEGPCAWSGGNLNTSNSTYYEGDGTPQRERLTDFNPKTQVLEINYLYLKGGKHAYDYLVSYNHSETWLDFTELCEDLTVTGGCVAGNASYYNIPPAPNAINQEAGQILLFNGSISGAHYVYADGETCSTDCEMKLFITVTASTTDTDLILAWGGHLAHAKDWGPGNSSAWISGASYHIGNGARDNQATGAQTMGFITFIKDAVPDHTYVFTYTTVDNTTSTIPTFYLQDYLPNTPGYLKAASFFDKAAGTYTVTEDTGGEWTLASVVCAGLETSGRTRTPTYTFLPASNSLRVNLENNLSIVCTFTNSGYTAVDLKSFSAGLANQSGLLITVAVAILLLLGAIFILYRSRKIATY